MKLDRFILLALPALVFIASLVFWRWRHATAIRARQAIQNEQNLALEQFLNSKVAEIQRLLARTDLSPQEARRQSEALLAEMETRNVDGGLDAFMADNRAGLDEELAKRQPS